MMVDIRRRPTGNVVRLQQLPEKTLALSKWIKCLREREKKTQQLHHNENAWLDDGEWRMFPAISGALRPAWRTFMEMFPLRE